VQAFAELDNADAHFLGTLYTTAALDGMTKSHIAMLVRLILCTIVISYRESRFCHDASQVMGSENALTEMVQLCAASGESEGASAHSHVRGTQPGVV
jgi:hypothetical protein